ncbi:MAG: VOC family protein [Reyranella sp.]|uniref:VOC family protein n=1 Tax=Reyranella sp. TaxID=1929291 RepID=UPI001221F649|nr:VOC family protein [Reyranella sp.]TAJ87955.1 MAG: VOC family protein [Reyranella sp.]TBR28698.1 MAG: VOC family protein [Reyranella sp.]
MAIQPYLFFNGRCEEALDFYKEKLGARVDMLMRFKENPDKGAMEHMKVDPESVMHASMHIGDAMIMCSDGMGSDGKTNFQGFSLALNVANEAEADKAFAALAKEGQIQMPIGKTFFSPRFGCVADKFGVSWMVIVPQEM